MQDVNQREQRKLYSLGPPKDGDVFLLSNGIDRQKTPTNLLSNLLKLFEPLAFSNQSGLA